jgi:hypothetical protein
VLRGGVLAPGWWGGRYYGENDFSDKKKMKMGIILAEYF